MDLTQFIALGGLIAIIALGWLFADLYRIHAEDLTGLNQEIERLPSQSDLHNEVWRQVENDGKLLSKNIKDAVDRKVKLLFVGIEFERTYCDIWIFDLLLDNLFSDFGIKVFHHKEQRDRCWEEIEEAKAIIQNAIFRAVTNVQSFVSTLPPEAFKETQGLLKAKLGDLVTEKYEGFDDVYDLPVSISFSYDTRFEHAHVIALPGSGKTNLLKLQIAEDIKAAAKGRCAVVVIDSQGGEMANVAPDKETIIASISHMAEFAPGGSMHGKLIVIEPDAQHPLALNPFKLMGELSDDPNRRQAQKYAIVDLLSTVFANFGNPLSPGQATLMPPVLRACLETENPTLRTFRRFMLPTARGEFANEIGSLDEDTQLFFSSTFEGTQLKERRAEVGQRLDALLTSGNVLGLMFNAPTIAFDLAKETSEPKVILINTNKEILQEQNCRVFGLLFIAMLKQMAQRRGLGKLPLFLYVDEAHDYIANDESIVQMLDQARKRNVGITLSHQRLEQLTSTNVRSAVTGAGTHFGARLLAHDASALSSTFGCKAELLQKTPVHHFMVQSGRGNAIRAKVPLFTFNRMSDAHYADIMRDMHERFCYTPEPPKGSNLRVVPTEPDKPDPKPTGSGRSRAGLAKRNS